MSPIDTFSQVLLRCDDLKTIHAYLAQNATSALNTNELLRAEWATLVSALDLYVHEKIAEGIIEIFAGKRAETEPFKKWELPSSVIGLIMRPTSTTTASQSLELEVRTKLSRRTFQFPDDISDGVRLISEKELWNEIAMHQGASATEKVEKAKSKKRELSLIVGRRNKIVHEGDLQPGIPRQPWPINRTQVDEVQAFIKNLIISIDSIV